ncbi:MAG: hypoxanthine phosphoribosyltransferase [bacterium]
MNKPLTILLKEKEIQERVRFLATQISNDYKNCELILIGVLTGAYMFMADMSRGITISVNIDFLGVTSYGTNHKSSGIVRIIADINLEITGKDVLLVEDICDTGLTLNYLKKNLELRKPNSLRICTLLDKPSQRQIDIKTDYTGFIIPDQFVVGYGMDYAEQYRNLPYIAILDSSS